MHAAILFGGYWLLLLLPPPPPPPLLLLPPDLYFSRLATRSPLTQCFTIQGCCCTWSSGILFSGSRTSNYKPLS